MINPNYETVHYPEIGELVIAVMCEKNLNSKSLAAAADSLGQSQGYYSGLGQPSLETYIAKVRKGYIWGDGRPSAKKAFLTLERLAWLMLALKLPEEHQLIMRLRDADSRFKYPPAVQGKTLAELLESRDAGLAPNRQEPHLFRKEVL